MRRCGAEKLPWLVVEVEVDAERAGCFAERQVRLGLVVDEAIPETRDWLGSPVRRTRTSGRMRVGPWYGALRGARHGQGGIQFHQHGPEHGEPASAADDRFCYPNRPCPEGRLARAFLRTELALLFLSSLLFVAFRSAARGGASPLSPPPPHAGDAHAARDASALRTCMWNPRAGRFLLTWWACCGSVGLWGAVVVSSYRQSLCFRFIPA